MDGFSLLFSTPVVGYFLPLDDEGWIAKWWTTVVLPQ
jgi:hypothetical protein